MLKKLKFVAIFLTLALVSAAIFWQVGRSSRPNLTANIASSVGNDSGGQAFANLPDISAQDQITDNGQTIPLAWTDDNTGENLIIKSDQKYYDASNQVPVYFSVANQSGQDQDISVILWFNDDQKKIEKVEKIENGQIFNFHFSIFNQFSIPQFLNRKSVNGYTALNGFSDTISASQINYCKAILKSPADTNQSEFFIEAIGNNGGYGHLDPYLTSGLVGYWSFNGPTISGTQVYDQSGNYATGTMSGANGLPKPVAGVSGQALKFDGVDDYIDLGASSTLKPTTSITISFWAKPSNIATDYSRFIDNEGASTGYVIAQGVTDGTINVRIGGTLLLNVGSISNNVWQQITAVYDGSNVILYQGGSYVTQTPKTGSIDYTGSTDTFLGRISSSNTNNFSGSIDEVRVYNRALTPDEIRHLYVSGQARINTSQAGRDTSGLVGEWTFDAPTIYGTQVYDQSGHYATGTMSGANGLPKPVAGVSGQALKFDGVDDYVNAGTKILPETGPMSITAWINMNSLNSSGDIVSRWDDVGSKFAFTFQVDINNITCYLRNNDNEIYYATTHNGVETNYRWVFAACTINNGAIYAYRYGDEQSERAVGVDASWSAAGTGATTTIGSRWTTGAAAYFFSGLIDEVRVYNRALSADEIKKLYTLGSAKINSSQDSKVTSGLVGLWSFDGNDMYGTTAIDRSGQNNNGTLTGANGLPKPVAGKIGQALSFDGVDDYIRGNAYNSSLDLLGTSFTLSAWVKPTRQAVSIIVDKPFVDGSHQGSYFDWSLVYNAGGNGRVSTYLSCAEGHNYNNTPLTVGAWNFIAVTYTGSTDDSFYLNGVPDGAPSQTCSVINSNSAPFRIGANGGGGENFPGLIDEVRVYNRALSADEIKRLYNMGR